MTYADSELENFSKEIGKEGREEGWETDATDKLEEEKGGVLGLPDVKSLRDGFLRVTPKSCAAVAGYE